MELDNMTASDLYHERELRTTYVDWRCNLDLEEYQKRIQESCTLYVGGLSPYTNEQKLFEILIQLGPIKLFKQGVHKRNFQKEGYFFVEYFHGSSAELAKHYFNKVQIDNQKMNVDFDIGYQDGRQYGRGFLGGSKAQESNTKIYENQKPKPFPKHRKIQKN